MYEIANEYFANVNQPIRFFDVDGTAVVEYDGGRARYGINFLMHYLDITTAQTTNLIDAGYEMIEMMNQNFGEL